MCAAGHHDELCIMSEALGSPNANLAFPWCCRRRHASHNLGVAGDLDVIYPEHFHHMPTLSFFAVYDGHGGEQASEYLKEHLHKNFCIELNTYARSPNARTHARTCDQIDDKAEILTDHSNFAHIRCSSHERKRARMRTFKFLRRVHILSSDKDFPAASTREEISLWP